jgi:hypothetical protein
MRLQPRISLVAQRHARKRGSVWPKQLDTSNGAPPPFTCSIVLDACSSGSCEDGDREPNARRPLCCPRQQVSRYQPDDLKRACVDLRGRSKEKPRRRGACGADRHKPSALVVLRGRPEELGQERIGTSDRHGRDSGVTRRCLPVRSCALTSPQSATPGGIAASPFASRKPRLLRRHGIDIQDRRRDSDMPACAWLVSYRP